MNPNQPPAFTELKTALGLSDAQVTALTDLQTKRQQATQQLFQQIAHKEKALHDKLNQAVAADAATLGQMLLDIDTLRKQAQSVGDDFQNQALKVLSGDQATKLQGLEAAQKLLPAVNQAVALQLLEGLAVHPAGGPGRGMGMMMRGPRPTVPQD